ncbi:MAG: hypothetical protein NXI09_15860 [Bacteroidetes bacterium]|nr:hypothetical protein [Bacteroidota bacterium]
MAPIKLTNALPIEPFTVYVNSYYIANHYREQALASKHYYMGSQRIASNMISADFDHEAPLLELIQAPEGRYGYTNAEAAIVDDILSTLRCLTGDEELAFDLGDFLYLPSIGEGISFTDDERADLAAEELPAWLACSQSLYWAQQGGVSCSGLELLYFYHSDYLGSVEFVTDMRGEAYQFFLNTPWGENIENQFARNYTAFSSRFRFNGKEWDEETGNFYYGARYYDPKISIWLSVDPWATEYPSFTPYNFVENNPIHLIDPTGLGPENIDENTNEDFLRDLFSQQQFEHIEYTIYDYKAWWNYTHGRRMTKSESKTLERGCIGVTCVELGISSGNPPLDDSFSSFSLAKEFAENLEKSIAANPGNYPKNARPLIFSKRFYSADKNGFLPDVDGRVDMSSYDYSAKPGYVNFDYGWYRESIGTWFHANHSEPGMVVYASTLKYYSRLLQTLIGRFLLVGLPHYLNLNFNMYEIQFNIIFSNSKLFHYESSYSIH